MSICPICGWPGLRVDYLDHEICQCCGTHFGVDDCEATDEEIRFRWIAGGMKWWSKSSKPADGWDPVEQIKGILD